MLKKLAIALSLITAATTTASAAPVYGTNYNMTMSGSRSDNYMYYGGNNTNWDDHDNNLNISWAITSISGGYHYAYTLTGFSRPDIDNFYLELSQNTSGLTNISGAQSNPSIGNQSGLPASMYGVKFVVTGNSSSPGGITISFDSSYAPVWGNFYVNGSSSMPNRNGYAYNKGMTNLTSENVNYFIARPDSVSAVPEPSSLALLGFGSGVLAAFKMRRRKATVA